MSQATLSSTGTHYGLARVWRLWGGRARPSTGSGKRARGQGHGPDHGAPARRTNESILFGRSYRPRPFTGQALGKCGHGGVWREAAPRLGGSGG
jgi:hypothetical protein